MSNNSYNENKTGLFATHECSAVHSVQSSEKNLGGKWKFNHGNASISTANWPQTTLCTQAI